MGMPVVFHEGYEVDIGPHVFPTAKYGLIRKRLLEEGVIREGDLHRSEAASDAAILLVHTERWMGKLQSGDLTPQEQLLLEVPYSTGLRDAAWLCAGGSILTGQLALEHGVAVHLGGGFHHAFPDHGEGFCPLNDVAVAVRELERQGVIERPVVIDCDVHHGNGTAAIFVDDAQVYTFSMHQLRNYPMHKPPGDTDVGLADCTGDQEYLRLLRRHLPSIVDSHRPDLAFYLAGADPYREDQLGGLALSLDGLRQRDELVLETLGEASVPVGVCLAGGYAQHTADTVAIHCATVAAAREAWERYGRDG
jgi:acetoin utilization deacetylase AcuC-like enzyme